MKPHIWLSCLYSKRGQWACCSAIRKTGQRLKDWTPTGDIYYGVTPAVAYNKWKADNVGCN